MWFVELAKAIAWPAVIVFLAILFRNDLRALIPRLRKAGPSGIELDVAADQQKKDILITNTRDIGKLKDFPGMVRTPLIEMVERNLFSSLDEKNIPETQKVDFLVRLVAQAQIETSFAWIYGSIFGSQILGLRRLNVVGAVSIDEARKFFNQYAIMYPIIYEKYGFDGWFGFLKNNNLVTQKGDTIEITDLARDFLQYLTARRLKEDKMY